MIGFWQGTKEAARTIPASCLVFSRNCSVIRLVCFTKWYHMNKKHWITVILDDSMPSDLVRVLIDHSYALVVKGLSNSI